MLPPKRRTGRIGGYGTVVSFYETRWKGKNLSTKARDEDVGRPRENDGKASDDYTVALLPAIVVCSLQVS